MAYVRYESLAAVVDYLGSFVLVVGGGVGLFYGVLFGEVCLFLILKSTHSHTTPNRKLHLLLLQVLPKLIPPDPHIPINQLVDRRQRVG